jgi:hypothetical protein
LDDEANEDARIAIEAKRMVLGQEREMRRAGLVVLRPSLNDPSIVRLQPLLVEEKKAECLLTICTSVYIIKSLRPLIKGRRGKGTISLCVSVLFLFHFSTHTFYIFFTE